MVETSSTHNQANGVAVMVRGETRILVQLVTQMPFKAKLLLLPRSRRTPQEVQLVEAKEALALPM